MTSIRRQLTLFISDKNSKIEQIRAQFNPIQFDLIPAHIILCREDEIESIEKVIQNITSLELKKPIQIKFDPVEKFAEGKGVFIPGNKNNNDFEILRKTILYNVTEKLAHQKPHITLLHPRNATCTDEIFEQIQKIDLPTKLEFNTISLIEQKNDEKWRVIKEFYIIK